MPKPEFRVNNIIIGALNVDLVSRIESTNHSTSDTCELTFETKNKKCILSGFGFDKRGNKLFEISGSWQDKITVKNIGVNLAVLYELKLNMLNPSVYGHLSI